MGSLTAQLLALADGFAQKDASALIRGVTSSGQNGPSESEVAALNAALFARNDAVALAVVARGLVPLYQISSDNLRRTTLPMLGIVGEHDVRNLEAVKRMAGVVRGLQVVEIPGAPHATSVRPCAEHILAFLAKHTRR